MAKSKESKIAEQLADVLNDQTVTPSVIANCLIQYNSLYTQDRIMELVKYIIKYEAIRLRSEWEKGNTSEGLLLADYLNDALVAKFGEERIDPKSFEDKRIRDDKYLMDLDSF